MTTKPIVALDIGPISERSHTGIANVAKFFAIELLGDASVECMFTFNRQVISGRVVERLVGLSGGDILWWIASRARSYPNPNDFLDRKVIGIYPGHKWHRRYFPFEVQIVHDLSAILIPQHHTREAAEFWQASLFGDIASSDLIATVSESTASDVRTYFPEFGHIPLIVSRLAPCSAKVPVSETDFPPYVVVFGTLEPRKNVLPLLRFIAANPSVLERASFVFVGRVGWGESILDHVERLKLGKWLENGRLKFTGFVGDRVRDYLIAHSRGVIYPSLYEGFGLPVLEAMALGVPVVTTTSSSLPEAGGDAAIYCDFSDADDIERSLDLLLDGAAANATRQEAVRRREWVNTFSWAETYARIRDAAISEYDRKLRGGISRNGNSDLTDDTAA